MVGFGFNLVASPTAFPSQQAVRIFTPASRVNAFDVNLSFQSNSTTSLLSILQTDPIDITITWVPAPGVTAVLVLAPYLAVRRRRHVSSY